VDFIVTEKRVVKTRVTKMTTTIIGLIIIAMLWFALGWFISHAKVQANEKMAGGIIEAARKEVENMLRMRGESAGRCFQGS